MAVGNSALKKRPIESGSGFPINKSVFLFTVVISVVNSSCPKNQFELKNGSCHLLFTCDDFSKFIVSDLIGVGAVKAVYKVKYEDNIFALSVLQNENFVDDFQHSLKMLINLNPSQFIVKLFGYCEHRPLGFITEYHKYGNAKNIFNNSAAYTIIQRLNFCVNYAEILKLLHSKNLVFCDSNTLEKILEQMLITDDLRLVLNDLDALPYVQNKNVTCGKRELTSNFVAPEQLWPFKNQPFDPTKMPGYDEKTDIWKIPNVCSYFLGDDTDSRNVQYHLFEIHKQCKNVDPKTRPNAEALIQKYNSVLRYLEKEL